MRTIKVKPLSREAFAKYGTFQNLLDDKSMSQNSVIPAGFFADLVTMNFGNQNPPTISVCSVKRQDKMVVSFLEAHRYTSEGLLPLDSDVVIYAGVPGFGGDFTTENLEAFLVPKGTFVRLDPLIVHGTQYPVGSDSAHIVCMLPARTFRNDMIATRIDKEDSKAELVL